MKKLAEVLAFLLLAFTISFTGFFFAVVRAQISGSSTAPIEISNITVGPIDKYSVTINWTTSRPGDSKIIYTSPGEQDNLEVIPATVSYNYSHSLVVTGLQPSNDYEANLYSCTQPSLGDQTCIVSEKIFFRTDEADVIISGIYASNITSSSVTIGWATNINASTEYQYGKTSAYEIDSNSVPEQVGVGHNFSLTYLEPETLYYYQITSCQTNLPDNCSSDDGTFTTLSASSAYYFYSVPNVVKLPDVTTIQIEWRTSHHFDQAFVYYWDTTSPSLILNEFIPCNESVVGACHATLSDLQPGSTYRYYVYLNNAVAGVELQSQEYQFTVDDEVAVTASAVKINNITIKPTPDEALIQWNTNLPATGIATYSSTSGVSNSAGQYALLRYSHVAQFRNIGFNQRVTYSINSRTSTGSTGTIDSRTGLTFYTPSEVGSELSITTPRFSTIGQSTFVEWDLNVAADFSSIYYWRSADDIKTISAACNSSLTKHCAILFVAAPGTYKYYVRTRSNDQKWHTSNYGEFTVSGSSSPDIIDDPTATTLTLSGVPPSTIRINQLYYFRPSVAGIRNVSNLSFELVNKAPWMVFDTHTGIISGQPTERDIGISRNIVLQARDGAGFAALPPYNVTVVSGNTADEVPVLTKQPLRITGTPVTSITSGNYYRFRPTVSGGVDKAVLRFASSNLPNWLRLDKLTGEINGTPTVNDIGVYRNILVHVFDGKETVSLSAFTVTVRASTTTNAPPPNQVPATGSDNDVLSLVGDTVQDELSQNKLESPTVTKPISPQDDTTLVSKRVASVDGHYVTGSDRLGAYTDGYSTFCASLGITDAVQCERLVSYNLDAACIEAQITTPQACELFLRALHLEPLCTAAGISSIIQCESYLLQEHREQLHCGNLDIDTCLNTAQASNAGKIAAGVTRTKVLVDGLAATQARHTSVRKINTILAQQPGGNRMVPLTEQTTDNLLLVPSESVVDIVSDVTPIVTVPYLITFDNDEDGLPNDLEVLYGTDINQPDTDGDGFTDFEEIDNGFDPLIPEDARDEKKLSPVETALLKKAIIQQPLAKGTVDPNYTVESVISDQDISKYRIKGTAAPNTVVLIYIYSELPMVLTVKTDEFGNWVYDLQESLIDGRHTVYVAVTDDTGKVLQKSNPLALFVRRAQAVPATSIVNDEVLPGNSSAQKNPFIIYYIIGGIVIVLIGMLSAVFIAHERRRYAR